MQPDLFIDPILAARLESCSTWRSINYARGYQTLHPQANCAYQAIAGGYAVYVGPGSPLNSARSIGMGQAVTAADVQALEDFFGSRGCPVQIHVCPLAHESLFALLRSAGYRLDSFFSMLVLPIPPDFQPAPLPDYLRVARALPEQAEEWLQVVAEGFEETSSPSSEAFDILAPNFHAPDSAAFMGWVDGHAAGGGGLYYHNGVVELGGASTRVEFRRRGVQRALIEARLAAARELGCDLATVMTEPGSHSQRNLQRFGFHLAYTKIVMMKSPKSSNS